MPLPPCRSHSLFSTARVRTPRFSCFMARWSYWRNPSRFVFSSNSTVQRKYIIDDEPAALSLPLQCHRCALLREKNIEPTGMILVPYATKLQYKVNFLHLPPPPLCQATTRRHPCLQEKGSGVGPHEVRYRSTAHPVDEAFLLCLHLLALPIAQAPDEKKTKKQSTRGIRRRRWKHGESGQGRSDAVAGKNGGTFQPTHMQHGSVWYMKNPSDTV